MTLFGKKWRSSKNCPRVHRQVLDSEVWCISPHTWLDVLSKTVGDGFQNNIRIPFLQGYICFLNNGLSILLPEWYKPLKWLQIPIASHQILGHWGHEHVTGTSAYHYIQFYAWSLNITSKWVVNRGFKSSSLCATWFFFHATNPIHSPNHHRNLLLLKYIQNVFPPLLGRSPLVL